jgi:hypothetical protein
MKDFNLHKYLRENPLTKISNKGKINEAFDGFSGVKGLGAINTDNPMATSNDTSSEPNQWIADIDRYPAYKGWTASWEHPGLIVWSNENLPYNIVATPGWDGPGTPVEVQYIDDDNVISGDTKVLGVIDQDNFKSFQDYLKAVAPYLNKQMGKTNPMMEMDAEEVVEEYHEDSDNFVNQNPMERMNGLINQRELRNFANAIMMIAQDLDDDGFDASDIKKFLISKINDMILT